MNNRRYTVIRIVKDSWKHYLAEGDMVFLEYRKPYYKIVVLRKEHFVDRITNPGYIASPSMFIYSSDVGSTKNVISYVLTQEDLM